ncbi:MAG: hypothetical protein HYW49_05490 [Deltaproteobacteria bacterium]|nr:hypothetical protein [Deltaproteobacteria bacterium]
MKTNKMKNPVLKAMAAMLLFSSMALAQQTAPTPGSINPDLQVPPAAYGPEVIAEINRQIEKMKSDVPQASTVHIPDYKYAYQILQSRIAFAITNYLKSLDQINGLMSQFLSDINGMQKDDPYIQALIPEELQKRVPKLNAQMNAIYTSAIRQLYLLDDNSLSFQIGKKWKKTPNQLKNDVSNPAPTALAICQTSACVKKLTDDIAAYNLFVEQFNQEIDFTNFDERSFLKLGRSGTVPVVSTAMADAAEKLMKGVEANRWYSIAALLGALIKQPAGMAVALASAPAYAFEKIAQFGRQVVGLQYLHVDLKLNEIAAYSAQDVNKSLAQASETHRMKLPTVVFDQAGREKMEADLKAKTAASLAELNDKYEALLSLPKPKTETKTPAPAAGRVALPGSSFTYESVTEIKPGVFRYALPMVLQGTEEYPLAVGGAEGFCRAAGFLPGTRYALKPFGSALESTGSAAPSVKSLTCVNPSSLKMGYSSIGTSSAPDGSKVTVIGTPFLLVGGYKVYIRAYGTPSDVLCPSLGFSKGYISVQWTSSYRPGAEYFDSVGPSVARITSTGSEVVTAERYYNSKDCFNDSNNAIYTEIACQ